MGLRIGYLGPEGTYSALAARRVFGGEPAANTWVALPSIDAVFAEVASGHVDRGVVPYENMIQGMVTETLDALIAYQGLDRSQVQVVAMTLQAIEHAIGVLPNGPKKISDVRQVFSKDQALAQCHAFLTENCPHLGGENETRVTTSSTAAAIDHVLKTQNTQAAVIAHQDALTAAGMRILASDVADRPGNKTRFAIIARVISHPVTSREDASAPNAERVHHGHEDHGSDSANTGSSGQPSARFVTTAVSIYPRRNRIGMLRDILDVISGEFGLNLSSIHARPDAMGAFRFFMELEGAAHSPAVRSCLQALTKRFGVEDIAISVLGSYLRLPFREQTIRTIGIVGGAGAMGQWLAQFFAHAGFQVRIWDKAHTREDLSAVDVVMISVPIDATESVVRKVGPMLREGQLLVDNTSVKTKPVAWMLAAAPDGVEVLGLHTVFGPTVQSIKGQNVVVTPTARSGVVADEFQNIFYKWGATLTQASPDDHDRHMAFHQCLEHVVHIALAQMYSAQAHRMQAQEHADTHAPKHFTSPNSQLTLQIAQRIVQGDPGLYASILKHNPYAGEVLCQYRTYFDALVAAVSHGQYDVLENAVSGAKKAFMLSHDPFGSDASPDVRQSRGE